MNPRLRRLVAGLATVAVALGMASVAAATSVGGTDEAEAGVLAAAAQCAADGKTVLVNIVVDASGSLTDTDPKNLRVNAVRSVLGSLESLANDSGGSVEVSLTTFGEDYDVLVNWGSISDETHYDRLAKAAKNQLPSANRDNLTHYRKALDGAQKSLNARAAQVESGDVCKVVVWFTDGQLDVDDVAEDPAPELRELAKLCDPNGTVDGLRQDGIAIVALALFSNQISRKDQDTLNAIAVGEAGGEVCGTPGLANGDYLKADDAGALNYVFAGAGSALEGLVPGGDLTCSPSGDCVLPIDAGVFVARVHLDRAIGDGALTLVAPTGESLGLRTGDAQLQDGTRVETASSPGLTTIQLTLPGDIDEDTSWTLRTGDGDVRAKSYFAWGVGLSSSAPSGFEEGKTTSFEFGLRTSDLKTVESGLYQQFVVTQTGEVPDGVTVTVDSRQQTVSVTIDEGAPTKQFELELQAEAVTKTSRHRLGPIAMSVAIVVVPPGSPNVETGSLNFGVLGDDSGGGKATLGLIGAEGGKTEACFGDVAIDAAPDAAGQVSILRSDGTAIGPDAACIELPQDGSVPVELTLLTEGSADGKVRGSFVVNLQTVDGQVLPAPVTFDASMVRPVNPWKFAATLAALITLAIAIAWLTALIGRHFADRFRFGPGAQYAAVDVIVTASGLSRVDGRAGELLDPAEDFHRVTSIGSSATTTSRDIDGLQYRRKAPFNPWRPARGVVSAPGRVVGWGQHAEMEVPDGSLARAPFPGSTGFVLSADPADVTPEQINGRFVMVMDAPDGVSSVLPERLADLRQVQWPELLVAFNEAAATVRANASQSSVVEREFAARVGTQTAVGSTTAPPDFTGDPGPNGRAAAPAPADSWLFDDQSANPSLPPASEGKRRGRGDRPRKSKSQPPAESPQGDGPPPPPDFLS